MAIVRSFVSATLLAAALTVQAQAPNAPNPQAPAARPPAAAASASATPAEHMATMDQHMQAMRAMHDKLAQARTPQERQALMADQMKLMQQGMALMGGMGPGAMAPMGGGMGMGGRHGMGPMSAASAPMDPATRQQMLEKRIEMMQSMMQMMMDRMAAPAARP